MKSNQQTHSKKDKRENSPFLIVSNVITKRSSSNDSIASSQESQAIKAPIKSLFTFHDGGMNNHEKRNKKKETNEQQKKDGYKVESNKSPVVKDLISKKLTFEEFLLKEKNLSLLEWKQMGIQRRNRLKDKVSRHESIYFNKQTEEIIDKTFSKLNTFSQRDDCESDCLQLVSVRHIKDPQKRSKEHIETSNTLNKVKLKESNNSLNLIDFDIDELDISDNDEEEIGPLKQLPLESNKAYIYSLKEKTNHTKSFQHQLTFK